MVCILKGFFLFWKQRIFLLFVTTLLAIILRFCEPFLTPLNAFQLKNKITFYTFFLKLVICCELRFQLSCLLMLQLTLQNHKKLHMSEPQPFQSSILNMDIAPNRLNQPRGQCREKHLKCITRWNGRYGVTIIIFFQHTRVAHETSYV